MPPSVPSSVRGHGGKIPARRPPNPGRRAACEAVNALGGIMPDPDPDAVPSLKGKEVLAVGPQSLQKILRSCDYYTEKCDGKDRELGGACRMVRELAKEVREQVEIIDRKSTEAAGEHDRMSTLLEQYLTVFTADSSLKTDLASVLGQEWVGARGHSVLTPEVLNDALAECCSLIHVLRRDLVNSQAQRARDLPKFEQAVQALAAEKNQEQQQLSATIAQLKLSVERERSALHAAHASARKEAEAAQLRQKRMADAAAADARTAQDQISDLQAQVRALQEQVKQRELEGTRKIAQLHMAHIAAIYHDATS